MQRGLKAIAEVKGLELLMDFIRRAYAVNGIEFACEENPTVSKELRDSLALLKWGITPRQVIALSRIAAALAFLVFAATGLLFFSANLVILIAWMFIGPAVILHYFSEYPKMASQSLVLSAIGEAPRTLVYLIVPLKQNPNLEEAFRFAAENSEGEIATDLRSALWKTWGGKAASVKGEIAAIAEKWGSFAPEFKHSLYLVASALSEKSHGTRALTLDRALSYSLEGIVSKMQEYVSGLFLPTLLIFSFGTIIPLMFVSLLPLLVYFGVQLSSPLEIAAILGITLLVLFIYAEKVLLQRPPSFSQSAQVVQPLPQVQRAIVALVSIVIAFPGILFLLAEWGAVQISGDSLLGWLAYNVNTLSLLWAVAIYFALGYYLQAEPLAKNRKQQRRLESELVGVLHQLASRLGEKRPPEEAMEFAARSSPNSSLASILGQASTLIKRRAATLESSLFDEKFGAARSLPSQTVKTTLRLFIAACRKGSISASQVLYTTSDYFLRLQKVEDELNSMLSKNISMLRATAIIFAPVVSAIVVVLFTLIASSLASAQESLASLGYNAGGLSSSLLLKAPSFSTPFLLLVVGAYMLGLCAVTMRYVSFIENGPDQVEYRLQLAKALPLSMLVFTMVLVFATNFLIVS